MDKEKETQFMGTISDFLVQKLKEDRENLEATREYLMSMFLSSATDALFYARRNAGLTQEQLAEKLGKKQSAIARWEADVDGKISLRQYIEIAQACGVSPFVLTLEPLEALRDFVVHNPEALPTQELYQTWKKRISEPLQIPQPDALKSLTVQTPVKAAPPTNATNPKHEGMQTVSSVERYLGLEQLQNMSLQLQSDNATNMEHTLSVSTANQLEVNQTFSSFNQEKAIAA